MQPDNRQTDSARAGARDERAEKLKRENALSEKADKAAKRKAAKAEKKRLKKGAKPADDKAKKPPKNIEIRRSPRVEPLGERLDYPGGFPVYLARYVLFGGERPHAAVRFYNGSDAVLTGVRFSVCERDEDGRILAEYSLERRGLNAERGGEFSVADFSVSGNCAQIEARIESAFSDPYEYVICGDGATVKYGVRRAKREYYFKNSPATKVKRIRRRLAIASAAFVAAAALLAGVAAWKTGAFANSYTDGADTNLQNVSVTYDVEA